MRYFLDGRQVCTDRGHSIHAPNLADGVRKIVRQAGVRHDRLVVDVVVAIGSASAHVAYPGGDEIKIQLVPRAPRDVVIRTRRVAADSDPADERASGIVEAETAS